ncbi:MAG: hypothetical protein JSU90_09140, partial [Nitrospiraceae bacterium]
EEGLPPSGAEETESIPEERIAPAEEPPTETVTGEEPSGVTPPFASITEPAAVLAPGMPAEVPPVEAGEGTVPGGRESFAEEPEIVIPVERGRVAVMPFENLTDEGSAPERIAPLLMRELEQRGFTPVDGDQLGAFICRQRVRSSGFIPRELARKIRARFGTPAILAGSIISFSNTMPVEFGVIARLIDTSDGRILWADYASATGEDFVTVLDLGRIHSVYELIPRVMNSLFLSFSREELFREKERPYRVAVLPLKNNSEFRDAGIIAMHLFNIELLKSPDFLPIEYGVVRDSVINLNIRSRGELSHSSVTALSEELGMEGIILGDVERYTREILLSSPSRVGITARLIDGKSSKILWYSSDYSSGDEDIIALDWGRLRSVHSVAYKVITSLVDQMKKGGRD